MTKFISLDQATRNLTPVSAAEDILPPEFSDSLGCVHENYRLERSVSSLPSVQ